MQAEYEFRSSDGGKRWTRRCFGTEQLIGVMSSKTPGFGMLTGGYVLSFPTPVSAVILRPALEAAWIRLRFAAPVIAYKTMDVSKDDTGNSAYALQFEYIVPEDTHAARAWAAETIKWHNDGSLTLRERDIALKNVFWYARDGKYNYELHAAPDVEQNKWQILIHAAHWSADVRGTLQLSELLLTYLTEYLLQNADPSLEKIKWGEETKKLTPPMAVVAAWAAGMPVDMLFPKPPAQPEPVPGPETDQSASQAEGKPESGENAQPVSEPGNEGKHENGSVPEQAAGPVFFLRPTPLLAEAPKYDAVATDVWLTKEETARFRAACKRRGITVTQAITALISVAEIEWALRHDSELSEEERKKLVETYETATHIPILWNVVDQRRKLKDYARHDSPKGSTPVAAEGFPLMIDMTTIRDAVKYTKDTGKVERNTSEEVFWATVAKHAQDLWKSSDVDLPASLEREMMGHAYSAMYDPTAYMIPALLNSSIGDIEALGLLTQFSPSNPNAQGQDNNNGSSSRLIAEQVSISVRCPTPTKMVLAWQWDGRLLIRPQTASRWTSQEGLDQMGQVIREWIQEACLKD